MYLVDQIRERKKMMKNRRRDVVRQIAVESDAPSAGNRGQIAFQNIAMDDREIREFFRKPLESCEEQRIQLDGKDGCSGGREVLRHFAVARADFYPAVRWIQRWRWRHGRMRRNADGARDLFAPSGVGKKMLAKSLTSHAPKV